MKAARGSTAMALALGLLALAGCAGKPAPPPPPAPAPPPPPPPRADEIAAIVALLDRGEPAAAAPRIDALLARDPLDADARLLRASIVDPPAALLGRASYPYTVRPGETLLELARRLLGNRLRFYALARYNDIAVPAALAAGRVLKMPGKAPAKPRPPVPKASAPRADPAAAQRLRAAALGMLRAGRIADATAALRRAAALDPGNPLVRRDLDRLTARP